MNMPMSAQNWIKTLPKTELHCHLEGTVSPTLASQLAAQHGLDISHIIDENGHYQWRDFGEFLKVYDAVADTVRTPEDYYEITKNYYTECAASGVIYAEVFLSPAHAEYLGMSYQTMLDSISAALDEVEAAHKIHVRFIISCVRHFGVEQASKVAKLAQDNPHPRVVGFGMAGDESAHTPRDFKPAFDIARDIGLHLTAHAGEHLGPDSIRAVIDELGVSRIGHGVRANEDLNLVAQLRDNGHVLELCPSSNICLGVTDSFATHPVVEYLDAGLKATINSDDPPHFFTTVAREYECIAETHQLGPEQMLQFTANAIDGAFCDEALKAQLRQQVLDWQAQH